MMQYLIDNFWSYGSWLLEPFLAPKMSVKMYILKGVVASSYFTLWVNQLNYLYYNSNDFISCGIIATIGMYNLYYVSTETEFIIFSSEYSKITFHNYHFPCSSPQDSILSSISWNELMYFDNEFFKELAVNNSIPCFYWFNPMLVSMFFDPNFNLDLLNTSSLSNLSYMTNSSLFNNYPISPQLMMIASDLLIVRSNSLLHYSTLTNISDENNFMDFNDEMSFLSNSTMSMVPF